MVCDQDVCDNNGVEEKPSNVVTQQCKFDVFLTVHHSIDLFQLPN
jgi:hypothetical protein